jgi:hypothetical protein
MQIAYSFVVDRGARFACQAWHLAHSLMYHCGAKASEIHIQCTPTADANARNLFERSGFHVHTLAPFADGKYCNKIAQLPNLKAESSDVFVLLDTDMIAVGDLHPWIQSDAISAKIVDSANPPIDCLTQIAEEVEFTDVGDPCSTDSGDGVTFDGNCNGGLYIVPSRYSATLSRDWRRWAIWLFENPDLLGHSGKLGHVDQVSFWMALKSAGLPFMRAPTNANYFVHFKSHHHYFEPERDIALLHYHNASLNVVGAIEPPIELDPHERHAVTRANDQIARAFNNELFWSYRYECFPARGSGAGSRGANLEYKRQLLLDQGIEDASSVLDVGCGDLEVIGTLDIANYVGVDVSAVAIDRARSKKPAAKFYLGMTPDAPEADLVLCFEVLIHQNNEPSYRDTIEFVAARTKQTLLISGYDQETDAIRENHMVFFYEPLKQSLQSTGRFSSIVEVGRHTDVVIYRCDA